MAKKIDFKQFGAELRRSALAFETEVKEIVELNLGDMELEAIRLSPGGGDLIKTQYGTETQQDIARGRNWVPISQAIGYKLTDKGLSGYLYVEKSAGEIAAWVEFGTGQSASSYLASTPKEWQATAKKYYLTGRGTIVNQPYLLPAFMKYKEEFVKDLRAAIANFGKK